MQIPNRRLLIDRLNAAMTLSARTGQGCGLLFLDLDRFKTLNDTLGHDMGDLLLQQVSERLISCARDCDTVARLGGDEFVVLLVGLSKELVEYAATVLVIGERIAASLNMPFQLEEFEYHITASIGATLFCGQDATIDELLKQADIAMYQSKAVGPNALCFFDPGMQQQITERVTFEKELAQALSLEQFGLHYQLQVDDSGRPTGAEALIRWFHPKRGMVSPGEFIPVAENSMLIIAIGQWVLDTACAQLKKWESNALTCELSISININAKEFSNDGFTEAVKTALQQHGINPKRLKLELTEGMLIENIEEIIVTMNELREIGVDFELDDFGTGYSSLQYLKKLPLQRLKIDQSFVRDIGVDASDQVVVRTIIAMANSLGLTVIAEGVETEEQRDLLFSEGCCNFQGYLFGKPVSVDRFEAQLRPKIH